MLKARILKRAGDPVGAAGTIDEGRSLDTADRFINSKCAKYLLRAEQIDLAIERMAEFIREGRSTLEHLNDYQTSWFQVEMAKAYKRLDKRGHALRCCHQIAEHFNEFFEDQLDFHAYCIRKTTLTSYVNMLKLKDNLCSHKFYFQVRMS